MNNILKLKVNYTNIILTLAIAVTFIGYIISMGSLPFGDDYAFLFENYHVKEVTNPLNYWNPTSISYKSWSLLYTLEWLLINTIGENFAIYRLINIILHTINAFLCCKILKDYIPKDKAKLISILFFCSPIVVESVFWIFQIGTLLSSTFCLLLLYAINKDKEFYKIFILYLVCLEIKILGILIPLYFIYKYPSRKLKITLLLSTMVLFISINTKGVISRVDEYRILEFNNTLEIDNHKDENLEKEIEATQKRIKEYIKKDFKKQEIYLSSYLEPLSVYIANTFSPRKFVDKVQQALSNIGRYTLLITGVSKNWLSYIKYEKGHLLNKIYASIGILIIVLVLFRNKYNDILYISLITYLPISGMFYVPYSKHSPIADHWLYLTLPFALVLFHQLYKLNNKLILSLTLIFSIKSFFSCYELQDAENYYKKNLSYNENSIILREYLAQLHLKKDLLNTAYNDLLNLQRINPELRYLDDLYAIDGYHINSMSKPLKVLIVKYFILRKNKEVATRSYNQNKLNNPRIKYIIDQL